MKTTLRNATALSAVLLLSACGGMLDKLSRIGDAPSMTRIQNPYNTPGYKPVTQPMPVAAVSDLHPSSLWDNNRVTFFKDERAHRVGDILTVTIDIQDTAALQNQTQTSRDGTESAAIPALLGFETKIGKILPDADPNNLASVNSESEANGSGTIGRSETIKLKLAATVSQVLPNGNLVINGRQQVRVNHELRDLQLEGIIRPEDVNNSNAIPYEKIAEARISYGGKGTVSDVQEPRYGQQLLGAIMPF